MTLNLESLMLKEEIGDGGSEIFLSFFADNVCVFFSRWLSFELMAVRCRSSGRLSWCSVLSHV